MTRVGEIYFSLGLKPDGKSWMNARGQVDRFAKSTERRFAGLQRAMTGALKGAALGAAGGLGVAFGVAAKDALRFDEALTRLDISSSGAMGSLTKVRGELLATSRATGVSKEALLEASSAFVALTGDGQTASQQMGTFARVQKATAASMADITGAAAAISQQLGVKGSDFEGAFSILVAGGKAGKVELKDLASTLPSLASGFKQFAGSQGLGGVAELGSAFQIVARNFGSASEAATGLESLMGSIIQNAKKLKGAGVSVFEADGKTLKSLENIVDTIAGKGFTPTKLIELLGRKEAYKALQALEDNHAEWRGIAKSTRHAKDVSVDYDKNAQSSAVQLQTSWNDLRVTIAEAFSGDRLRAWVGFLKEGIKAAGHLADGLSRIPGYMEFLQGEGAVDRLDASGAFEKFAMDPEVQAAAGVKQVGKRIGGRDLTKIAELVQAGELDGLRMTKVGWRDQMDVLEGAGAQVRQEKHGRKSDLARYGFSPGDPTGARRLDVDGSRFYDSPTMMEADAARGPITIQTSVSLTVDANADSAQFEAGVKRIVEADREKLSREIAAHIGQ